VEAAGLASSTLVVFTSDNGHAHLRGVRDLEKLGHFASARFRGYKTDIWEGGHRVPFIVRWPGVVRPASRSEALVCLNDFMALTAEILGVRLPEAAAPDSVSFLSALKGASSPGGRTAVVHHSQEGRFAIRRGRWKLCLNPGSGGMGAPTDEEALRQALPEAQLYDLAADPGETTNLVSTHPAEARALARLLETDVARGRSTAGPAQANDVPVVLPVPDFLRRAEARPAPR
jgi:arylsulfatase A-like enzyme